MNVMPTPCGSCEDTIALHPLEPLTREEMVTAAEIVKADVGAAVDALRFETIELLEPDKSAVRAFNYGDAFERAARVNVFYGNRRGVTKYTVSITDGTVLSKEDLSDVHPMIQGEEFMQVEECVKADPRFIEACKKRGIEDMDLVCVDPWSAGSFGDEGEEGRHISHTFAWVRSFPDDNLYAHPIEGVNAVVDITELKVLRVDDYGVVPVPKQDSNYTPDAQPKLRDDLKPIDVVQPEGVTFKMTGKRIDWHEWSMVIGFNGREGLTLHDISYGGRPLCYRASIAEMVVPYGSPKKQHSRKNVFDIGEYGIGKLANSLELGCDCLGAIHYLDCYVPGIDGVPVLIKNGICIHEEDYGIQWKHWDFRTEKTEVRRARRLVISFVATVGNYEYGSYWYFYLDGEMEFEMKATGIINTVSCDPEDPNKTKYGTEVSPGVIGQNHQHIFIARLDMSVDGDLNTVKECDTDTLPMGPENPYGNAFFLKETPIEVECGRSRNPDVERYWKIASAEKTNAMGAPTAYKLAPVHSCKIFQDPNGPSGKRMGFCYSDLWVTPYDPEERFPAGEFVNNSDGSDGIATWVQQERPVAEKDIVVWHTFGLHHITRLEDFPVQPCVMLGFKLMPVGFFDRNPTLDLQPDTNKASKHALAAE